MVAPRRGSSDSAFGLRAKVLAPLQLLKIKYIKSMPRSRCFDDAEQFTITDRADLARIEVKKVSSTVGVFFFPIYIRR